MEGQWVHGVSAPLKLITFREKENSVGCVSALVNECSDVTELELLMSALGRWSADL